MIYPHCTDADAAAVHGLRHVRAAAASAVSERTPPSAAAGGEARRRRRLLVMRRLLSKTTMTVLPLLEVAFIAGYVAAGLAIYLNKSTQIQW